MIDLEKRAMIEAEDNLDKRENEIVDGEREETDLQEKNCDDRER